MSLFGWIRSPERAASARRTYFRFVPRLEQLEPRLALTGNVAAVVSGGSLIVTGTSLGADIYVSQPRAGQINLAGNGTTVNGSTAPVTFSGVTRSLTIDFVGNGDDLVIFDGANPITLSGNLSINGGQGSNTVIDLVGALNVGGNLAIINPPGATETTNLSSLNVKGNVQIQNLGGDASVSIAGTSANTIGGNLLIVNGPGDNDATDLFSVNVRGNVQVQNQGATASTVIDSPSGQSNIGGSLQVINGPGQGSQTPSYGTYIVGMDVGQNLQVTGCESGDNSILLQGSEVRGNTNLNGGNGSNAVVLDTVNFGGGFQLQTGNGAGTTVLVDSANFGGNFLLQTGNGADTLSIGSKGVGTMVKLLVETRTIQVIDSTGQVLTESYNLVKPVYEHTTLAAGPVTFNGPVTVNLGGGGDTLNLATGAAVTFRRAATLDDQGGQNTANVDPANLSGVPKLKGFQVINV